MGTAIPGMESPNAVDRTGGAQPKFIYVWFEGAMLTGEVCQWSDTAGYLGLGVEDTVADSSRVAGVVCQDMAAAGWGWIQTHGYCDYIITDGAVDAPDADTLTTTDCLLVADNASHAEGQTSDEVATSTHWHSVFAINLAADTSDNTGFCILHCHYNQ